MTAIYHMTRRADWFQRPDPAEYRLSTHGKSLEDVGFIHCSHAHQVTRTAGAVFPGVEDLILLAIDTERLTAPVVEEGRAPGAEAFPHIYGPLNADAVTAIYALLLGADGHFVLPPELSV